MEIVKLSLPLQSIVSDDRGTHIVGANNDIGLSISEKGTPLGKYKDSEANFNSHLEMEFYDSLQDVEAAQEGLFKRFYTVTGINSVLPNGKDVVYSITMTSEATENNFFMETITLTTNDKKLANKFKYGKFIVAYGGIVNA